MLNGCIFETQTSAQGCRYQVEFLGDHRSKTKFANDFPNEICITNCKPRYSKSELKNVFRIMGKTLVSVNAKIGSPLIVTTVSNVSCMSSAANYYSCHCLVYVHVLLEDLNQISRTEKCHFAFYIFHEQRFHSFTSRFVKSRVVARWCISAVYFYLLTWLICTNLQKDILYIMWISIPFRHSSDIPTHEETSQVWHLNRSECPIRICIKSVKICLKWSW